MKLSIVSIANNSIPAGFPSPAMDYIEERIDLNDILINRPLSTYLIETEGDSLSNAFIPPKAKMLVDRSLTPENGDLIVAVINGAFTVKFLKKNGKKGWLVPANKKYKEIEITADLDFQVWGKVIYIITDTKDLKSCMP